MRNRALRIFIFLLFAAGCSSGVNNTTPEPTAVLVTTIQPSQPQQGIPTKGATPTNTIKPTGEATLSPTIAGIATVETPAGTVTTVPEATDAPEYSPHGILLMSNSQGVVRFSLEDSSQTNLLQRQEEWLEWRVGFSPSGKKLAYWFQTETASEIWLANVEPWSTELLLALPVGEYEGVIFEWLGTERYVYVELRGANELGIAEIVRSFLFDTEEGQLESSPEWRGFCSILAYSPRTERLASWCPESPFYIGGVDHEQYYVVETTGDLWTTEESPEEFIRVRDWGTQQWVWSLDGNYVAFTTYESGNGVQLHYGPVEKAQEDSIIDLSNGRTNYYERLSLSPDKRYLAFIRENCPGQPICHLVLEISTQEILWTNQKISNSDVTDFAWSPDSQYFAVDFLMEGLFIVETQTGNVVLHLPEVTNEEMIWFRD